jgi:hypothetical protein
MAFPAHNHHIANLPIESATSDLVETFNNITPFQDCLLKHLPISDILSLHLVTKRLADPYNITTATQFRMNAQLREQFQDCIDFRNQQAQSGVLITRRFRYSVLLT